MWTPWGRMQRTTLRDTGGRKRMAIATSELLCEWPHLHFRGLASIAPGFFFSSQNHPVIIDWQSTLEKENVFTWRGWVGSSSKMIWNPAQVSDEEETAAAETADRLHQPRTPLGPEPGGSCGRKSGKAELGKMGKWTHTTLPTSLPANIFDCCSCCSNPFRRNQRRGGEWRTDVLPACWASHNTSMFQHTWHFLSLTQNVNMPRSL